MTSVQIVNHSHLGPTWRWIESAVRGPDVSWSHCNQGEHPWLQRVPRVGVVAARLWTASRAVSCAAASAHPLLVSHGPRPGFYAARVAQLRRRADVPHLIFAFNFTELPAGRRRTSMARAYQSVDRFTVSSSMERTLYADCFGIDPARIDMLHWGVRPEDPATLPRPAGDGRYICAIGSQGRDYRTLLEAARRLPHVPLHLVAHPDNLEGLTVPSHVTVHLSVPYQVAAGIVANAEFMVLPLLHGQVPCGHVTAVMAMHLGRAVVATDSVGLHDYLIRGETAQLVEPASAQAMAEAVARMWEDQVGARAMGERGRDFARRHCLEAHTIAYFHAYLRRRMGVTLAT